VAAIVPLSAEDLERKSSFAIAISGDHPMTFMQVFDPPMCCSTGVCGPNVNSALPRFAADLEWLKEQGVEVHRHNLAQEPRAFAENDVVKNALSKEGDKCLPLILVDGDLVAQGVYPSRGELAALAGLPSGAGSSLYSSAVEELVAIGAAIGAGCEPCFKHHFREARRPASDATKLHWPSPRLEKSKRLRRAKSSNWRVVTWPPSARKRRSRRFRVAAPQRASRQGRVAEAAVVCPTKPHSVLAYNRISTIYDKRS
jgi:AhpD family alkylhydroperoxidase